MAAIRRQQDHGRAGCCYWHVSTYTQTVGNTIILILGHALSLIAMIRPPTTGAKVQLRCSRARIFLSLRWLLCGSTVAVLDGWPCFAASHVADAAAREGRAAALKTQRRPKVASCGY